MKRVFLRLLTFLVLSTTAQLHAFDQDLDDDHEVLMGFQAAFDNAQMTNTQLERQLQQCKTTIKVSLPYRPCTPFSDSPTLELINDKKCKDEAAKIKAETNKIERENKTKQLSLERINHYLSRTKQFKPIWCPSQTLQRAPLAEISTNISSQGAFQNTSTSTTRKPAASSTAAPSTSSSSSAGKPPRPPVVKGGTRLFASAAAAAAPAQHKN